MNKALLLASLIGAVSFALTGIAACRPEANVRCSWSDSGNFIDDGHEEVLVFLREHVRNRQYLSGTRNLSVDEIRQIAAADLKFVDAVGDGDPRYFAFTLMYMYKTGNDFGGFL